MEIIVKGTNMYTFLCTLKYKGCSHRFNVKDRRGLHTVLKSSHRACKNCQKILNRVKQTTRRAVKRAAMPKKIIIRKDYGSSRKKLEKRNAFCSMYDECLNKAAKKNRKLVGCETCEYQKDIQPLKINMDINFNDVHNINSYAIGKVCQR